MNKKLRVQLAVWYLAFFSVLFVLLGLVLYGVLSRSLERRLDEALLTQANTAAALMREELGEMHGDPQAAASGVIAEMQPRGSIVAVLQDKTILAASGPVRHADLERAAVEVATSRATDSIWRWSDWGKYGARGAALTVTIGQRTFVVMAVESLDSIAQELRVVRDTLWAVIPLVLAVAGIGGYVLARRGLAPLDSMAAQGRQITGDSLHTRLTIGDAAEELVTLATSFNELLSRLDQSFESMRRFVQDASHELRTPLSVIQGEADVALSRERSAAEYKESLANIQDESRRLARLVADLLNLASADAGHVQLRVEELYLNDLLAECCRSVRPLAAARNIELECHSSHDVTVRGDEELLRRMILNLLDNAIRYTPPGGRVSAGVETQGSEIRIQVADTGIGIAPEASLHVFERFYRADKARSRQEGGFGLGLSIVKWIAESHHGAVELASQPGQGSTFTVHLQRTK
ncbi:MAG TPA: heavy metal sensor histidine kinase [Bryobacteraceae bacterium]|jgi:heavy metal sensor kinase|nr:heavy metal sensor histidine kinase [Bryobacteraceae bacterium]